jgi:quinol monooxygenase YgiN
MPPADSAAMAAAEPPGEADYASPARPELQAAPPYGRILIFTLLDDRVADFDRLAEQAAEEVRTREPDTLVYVIHLVPNAPMQRIFYEIYRDRAAFDSHENQPYMMRFVADRRACVLATNVIELRLKYAKVAPLPGSHSSGQPVPAAPRAQLAPGSPPGPPRSAPRPQSLEPLPPRPDRRLPSAERRYGGI